MKKTSFLAVCLLLCTSCNYKVAQLEHNGDRALETSIPVIKKDAKGILRNQIAREMAYTNRFNYKDRNAKYKLLVTITEDSTSKIAFMWDRNPQTNADLEVFYPTEGQREVVAKVELVDAKSGEKVIEPFFLKAESIYDFVNPTVPGTLEFNDPYVGDLSVLQYSLGQLDSEEGAQAESYRPAYEDLAKKIVSRLAKSKIKTGS